jgi:hypothetical protein
MDQMQDTQNLMVLNMFLEPFHLEYFMATMLT